MPSAIATITSLDNPRHWGKAMLGARAGAQSVIFYSVRLSPEFFCGRSEMARRLGHAWRHFAIVITTVVRPIWARRRFPGECHRDRAPLTR